MQETDSRISALRLSEARTLLAAPLARNGNLGGVMAAAAFFAIAALALATAVVVMPTPWPT